MHEKSSFIRHYFPFLERLFLLSIQFFEMKNYVFGSITAKLRNYYVLVEVKTKKKYDANTTVYVVRIFRKIVNKLTRDE